MCSDHELQSDCEPASVAVAREVQVGLAATVATVAQPIVVVRRPHAAAVQSFVAVARQTDERMYRPQHGRQVAAVHRPMFVASAGQVVACE